MILPAFRKVKTALRDVEQLQTNVGQQFQALRDCPFLVGATITADLVAGDNVVSNPLQQSIQGWIMTDLDAAETVYRSSSDSQTITFFSTGTATAKFWIF